MINEHESEVKGPIDPIRCKTLVATKVVRRFENIELKVSWEDESVLDSSFVTTVLRLMLSIGFNVKISL